MKKIPTTCAPKGALLGFALLALASCGDETNDTKVTNETTCMEVAASADSLGTCDSASVGKMMFASDENAVYICADSGWTPLSEKAADGKDGADGLDGASCTLKTLSAGDGYKVICGGDSVGVIYKGNGEFTDERDGQTYKTLKIGSQVWMAENLNYDYNQNTAKSYCYNNDTANCTKYGRLYTWAAAMDSAAVFSGNGKGCGYGKTCSATKPVRGGCPEGWHLPSSDEWSALKKSVANSLYNGATGNVGYALKSTSGWSSNGNGSDAFGFGALPAGYRFGYGSFYGVQSDAGFWSSTELSTYGAYYRYLYYAGTDLFTGNGSKKFARSVRCVKD